VSPNLEGINAMSLLIRSSFFLTLLSFLNFTLLDKLGFFVYGTGFSLDSGVFSFFYSKLGW
jgi:hypothetical protein